MLGSYRLPLRFDVAPLVDEVRDIATQVPWVDHWGAADGAWGVIALVSADADPLTIHSAGVQPGTPTALLSRAPGLSAVIASFRTPIINARLNRLRPRGSIHPHRDFGYDSNQRWSYERGYVRIHVPLLTDDRVSFFLAGQRIDMQPGEAWYLNVCRLHSVDNRSDRERIHLVLDVHVNDWLRRLFPPASLADEIRGRLLRRFEGPLWKLAKPLLARLPGWRTAGRSRMRSASPPPPD